MALKKGKMFNNRYIVEYKVTGYYLYEHNTETGYERKYDLFGANENMEKLVFKTRLASNTKRDYFVYISSLDLLLLKRIGWL